jgi:hypothetical protein
MEYSEATWGMGFLPWSSKHGFYMIFHVKLLVLGHVRALDYFWSCSTMFFFCDDLVSSRFLCYQLLKSRCRVIWTSKVAYI